MFASWFRVAIWLIVLALLGAVIFDGPFKLVPAIIIGFVLYGFFHVARGFASAKGCGEWEE